MNGLFILRQITPQADLANALSELYSTTWGTKGQLVERDDGTFWVDDLQARDPDLNVEIGTITLAWGIFDSDFNLIAKYSRLDRAERALAAARPVIKTEIEFDEDAPPPDEVPDNPLQKRRTIDLASMK